MNQTAPARQVAVQPLRAALRQSERSVADLKPKRGRLLLALAVGVALAASGAGLVAGVFWLGLSLLWCLPGLTLALLGVGLTWAVSRLASLRLWVSPGGFAVATLGRGESCRYYHVESGAWAGVLGPEGGQATLAPTSSQPPVEETTPVSPAHGSTRRCGLIRIAPRANWPEPQSLPAKQNPTRRPSATPWPGKPASPTVGRDPVPPRSPSAPRALGGESLRPGASS
jgi:hypothetical protein